MDFKLYDDILNEIFKYLTEIELISCSKVCKQWNHVIKNIKLKDDELDILIDNKRFLTITKYYNFSRLESDILFALYKELENNNVGINFLFYLRILHNSGLKGVIRLSMNCKRLHLTRKLLKYIQISESEKKIIIEVLKYGCGDQIDECYNSIILNNNYFNIALKMINSLIKYTINLITKFLY